MKAVLSCVFFHTGLTTGLTSLDGVRSKRKKQFEGRSLDGRIFEIKTVSVGGGADITITEKTEQSRHNCKKQKSSRSKGTRGQAPLFSFFAAISI